MYVCDIEEQTLAQPSISDAVDIGADGVFILLRPSSVAWEILRPLGGESPRFFVHCHGITKLLPPDDRICEGMACITPNLCLAIELPWPVVLLMVEESVVGNAKMTR